MMYRATVTDIDVLAAIHATAFSRADAWSRDVFDLQLAMPNVFGLLHRSGGTIIVRVAADEAEVLTLAVVPEIRRSGVGATLLREAVSQAAGLGAHTVFLEVSVTNIAARGLYSKAGFIQVGRRRHYYSNNVDALVLRLDLDSSV
jgi:ribosomal-protein-alanine N-acetyltransferase